VCEFDAENWYPTGILRRDLTGADPTMTSAAPRTCRPALETLSRPNPRSHPFVPTAPPRGQSLESSGVRLIRTPFRAPNCNAYAERFVRAIGEECLDRVIPLGERHFRRTVVEFVCTLTANATIRDSPTN
jgi:hypothetical protein